MLPFSPLPPTRFFPVAKYICSNCKIYLSKLQNVFVQIAKCICPKCKMYLSKLQNVFVQIAKCICPNWKKVLSKLQNVFVQIAKCICLNPCLLLEVITQYIESLSDWMTLNAPHQYLKHFISIWAHSCLSSFHTLSLFWIEQSASELEISYHTLSLFFNWAKCIC